MVKDYVLVWRSDVSPGSIKLVGPFDTESQASSWGRVWQKAHQDNPCWQCIQLADPGEKGSQLIGPDGIGRPDGPYLFTAVVARPGTPEANS